MSDVFISYRRDDSAGETRSIRDRLAAVFSRQRVFMDVDAIPVGVDFREYLAASIRKCRVVLVVIGPHWLNAANAQGKRRLDDPGDYVRIEIELALKRESNKDICIIPVLLNGASMPPADQLPQSVRPLVYRNAIDVRHGSFERDVAELIKQLRRHVQPAAPKEAAAKPAEKRGAPFRMIALGAVAAVALILAVSLAILFLNKSRGIDPQWEANRVTDKIRVGDFEGASNLVDDLLNSYPELADAESFQAARSLLKEELERQNKFNSLRARLDNTSPEQISKSHLDDLRKLARTPEEKAHFAKLQEQQLSALATMSKVHHEKKQQELTGIEAEIEKLRSAHASQAQVIDTLSSATKQLAAMTSDSNLSADMKQAAGALLKTARALLDSEKIQPSQTAHAKSINDSLGDPPAYWKALQAFAHEYPASAAAADIRKLGPEIVLWESMKNWSTVFAPPEFSDLRKLTPAAAQSRLAQLEGAEGEFGPCPWGQQYAELSAFLLGVSSRVDRAKQRLERQLQAELTKDPWLSDLWMLESNGERFYGAGAAPSRGEGANIQVTVFKDKRRQKQQKPFSQKSITYLEIAPQSKLKIQIDKALAEKLANEPAPGTWEEVFCDLLAAVRTEPKLDPILAVYLYNRLLTVATTGSSPMRQVFASDRLAINRYGVDETVNWLDPHDDAARIQRNKATQVLSAFGKSAEKRRETVALAKRLSESAFPRFEWRGWLARDELGAWQVASAGLGQQAELYVVTIDPEQSTKDRTAGKLSLIGHLNGGKPQWVDDKNLLVEGRPVYVRQGSR
jgi:hypothetical protein